MRIRRLLISTAVLIALAVILYQFPPINRRLAWRVDFGLIYLRSMAANAGEMPTSLPPPSVSVTQHPTPTLPVEQIVPTATATVGPTATPTIPPTPIPQAARLAAPTWEKQEINNCGPATLAMYLRYFGWQGDQSDIAELIKPIDKDRNVNVEELIYYMRTREGWLNAEFRVGGDLELLRKLLAAGIPVMIEEGFLMEESYWPNDDRWAGHYLLVNGYDEASRTFTAQDSYKGPDLTVTYEVLDENWKAFNRVYILIYPPELNETVSAILGEHMDADYNRQAALDAAKLESEANPEDAFAWFNLGSNLVYFERYNEAGRAYDMARNLGLPHRMLRYQFGPFFAYFHGGRNEDLMTLVDYALLRTPNSEEALLWRGWGYYRDGKTAEALADFQSALEHNPTYQDAQYALQYVNANP